MTLQSLGIYLEKNMIQKDTYTPLCIAAVYNTAYSSQDMEATYMSINRGMDKEDVVHIYSGILLRHEKEWNWVVCRDKDGPREYHAEWSKSEKQISQINSYMWNPEE